MKKLFFFLSMFCWSQVQLVGSEYAAFLATQRLETARKEQEEIDRRDKAAYQLRTEQLNEHHDITRQLKTLNENGLTRTTTVLAAIKQIKSELAEIKTSQCDFKEMLALLQRNQCHLKETLALIQTNQRTFEQALEQMKRMLQTILDFKQL